MLKDCTRRQTKEEYLTKIEELGKEFAFADSNLKYESMLPTRVCKDKDSFGDADILYSTLDDKPFIVSELDKEFNPTKIIKNGEVISFDYQEMQVDMIHCERSYFKYAYKYHGFSDVGNLANFPDIMVYHMVIKVYIYHYVMIVICLILF